MKISTNEVTNISQLNLAYDFIKELNNMNYEYIYRGEFTKSIIANILSVTSNCLDKEHDTKTIKKRIFFILVECLQNIAKHQDKFTDKEECEPAIVMIQKRDMRYYVTTGNLVDNESIEELKHKLDTINNMDEKQLKAYYNDVLVNLDISDKGGAGLGFISMARKTLNNKLYYDFQKVDDKLSYFYLRTEVPTNKNIDDSKDTQWKYSFDKLKSIHQTLIKEKIVLNFSGSFDKDNLLSLIPIVDAQVYSNVAIKKIMFNIIYEMLNNIVYYSEDYSSIERKIGNNTGIFLLSANDDKLILTSGNYIHNSIISTLKQKIEFINNTEIEELTEIYKQIEEYFQKVATKQPDLSIIEMKTKTKNNLSYKFSEVSDLYSFFTLQTAIDVKQM